MKEKAPLSVVVGKLRDPAEVIKEDGSTVILPEWHKRAMWSYLRLIHGRTIDDKIKAELEQGKDMADVFAEHFDDRPATEQQWQTEQADSRETRTVQFILDDEKVRAVATMKHLLIEPAQVYETAEQILGFSASSNERHGSNLLGQVYELEQGFAGIKVGVQIDGGDLTTRFAIRVGVFARVEMCFNPLSWLGVSGLGRFAIPSDYERVLRIQKLNELFPRLQASIINAKEKLGDLKAKVEHAKTVPLSSPTATVLTGAMGMAYGLGEKTIRQVLDRYKEEDKSQYGLAMAQSWTAQHGKHRRTPEEQTTRVPQSLSTISGATLLIDDIKEAEAKARKWLRDQASREASKKLAEDLLKGRLA